MDKKARRTILDNVLGELEDAFKELSIYRDDYKTCPKNALVGKQNAVRAFLRILKGVDFVDTDKRYISKRLNEMKKFNIEWTGVYTLLVCLIEEMEAWPAED
ncbi:hypothetical protein ACFLY0_00970 [Patescibacteria group bacterium]